MSAPAKPSDWLSPTILGPTWQRDDEGQFILPDRSFGWQALDWIGENLKQPDGRPWSCTPEQSRFILWWYAVDDAGRFLWSDGVLQRLKGWGKDPMLAVITAVEFVGPCRFGGWDNEGQPIGVENPQAWVSLAAVSKDQNRNTMTLFPSLFRDECIDEHQIDLGKEIIYAHRGARRIEAVTSSPRALEGGRPTFTGANETHHWLANNDGHEMWSVIARNAAKSADGSSRRLAITNAYEPSEDSVAQRTREAHEEMGERSPILYDSIEAHPDAPLTAEAAPAVVESVRGDSHWLDTDRIVVEILDPRNPPSRSRRFWYNQVVASEDAWADPGDFELCGPTSGVNVPPITDSDEWALFFDGSKSDDATGIVACRISDGHVETIGMWQRPPGRRGEEWIVPRYDVDAAVSELFDSRKIVGFYGDPSHTLDDETQVRYWDGLLDDWHRRWCDRLEVWAQPGRAGHAVMWDMASPARIALFTAAAERCLEDIENRTLTHDGDARLVTHTRNARRALNKWGVSVRKDGRESSRKIDLAVCMIGARMVRRDVLNRRASTPQKPERSGRVY